jgi:hypothetical protein
VTPVRHLPKFANNNSLVDPLAKNNNIQNINLIYVGQQLLIKDNGEITQATQAQHKPCRLLTRLAPQVPKQARTRKHKLPRPATSSSDDAAKAWIAARESGGSYTAQNGNYYGKVPTFPVLT